MLGKSVEHYERFLCFVHNEVEADGFHALARQESSSGLRAEASDSSERTLAKSKLDKSFEGAGLSESDRDLSERLGHAILDGDRKAISDTIKAIAAEDVSRRLALKSNLVQVDHSKNGIAGLGLHRIANAINVGFRSLSARTNLKATPDGNLLVYVPGDNTGVEVRADGMAILKPVGREKSVEDTAAAIFNSDAVAPYSLLKCIADQAVEMINLE